MSRVEVLCATMNQKTILPLCSRMNIQTDAVLANQAEKYDYCEETYNGHKIKMITTPDRGVGKNRNIALIYSDADILLFADDDMEYVNDYEIGIIKAFEELPQADVIIFSCSLTKQGKIYKKVHNPLKKRSFFNSLRYGACVTAIRKKSLLKANITFSHLFGGGAIYGSGEDSLFLRDCFKNKLKVYSHPFVIGNCAKDTSTWFTGYHEKFFYDKGAWIASAFPTLFSLIKFYFLFRFRSFTELSFHQANQLLKEGIKGFSALRSYQDFREKG